MVNKQRMLEEFFALVKIKSASRQERQEAEEVKKRLTALGLTVQEDDAGGKIGGNCGNLFARLPGTVSGAPTLLLSAHLDSVDPCEGIQPKLHNGVITSSGDTVLGSDDKAGIVGILEALRQVQENNLPHGDVLTVFTVSEEWGLGGSQNIDRSLLKADYGYILDADGTPGEIITQAPGQNRLDITIYGKSAHAGLEPEKGINAIVAASAAVAQMRLGRIDDETTANIGVIHGGRATNIVPDLVKLEGEARSRDKAKLDRQTEHMVTTCQQAAAAHGARAEAKVTHLFDAFTLAPHDPVVELAQRAAVKAGLTPHLGATGGGSDANHFNAYGVPCAVLGVGMSKAHTTEEFLREEDLYNTAVYVVSLITTAAAWQKGKK